MSQAADSLVSNRNETNGKMPVAGPVGSGPRPPTDPLIGSGSPEQVQARIDQLLDMGTDRGYLTYEELNTRLPDEVVSPDKLDSLLMRIDEMGIRPSVIAGTSIGALLGATYALGMPGYRIRALAEETLGRRFDLARQLFAARSDPVQKLLRLLPIRSSFWSEGKSRSWAASSSCPASQRACSAPCSASRPTGMPKAHNQREERFR